MDEQINRFYIEINVSNAIPVRTRLWSKVFSLEKTLTLTWFWKGWIFFGRGEGRRLAIELLDLCKVYMPNISLLLGLEPFKKFSVGGGWWIPQ